MRQQLQRGRVEIADDLDRNVMETNLVRQKEVTQRLRTELDEIWGSMASSGRRASSPIAPAIPDSVNEPVFRREDHDAFRQHDERMQIN